MSVNLEKVRKLAESCPTILLKVDTGADVNLLNSTTFDQIIGNRSILQPSTLKMETCMAVPELKYLESSMHS